MLKIILLLLQICGLCLARTSSELRIRVEDGRIEGRYLTSESGKTIRTFMGIPYAQPPVGSLRFKAPLKVKPWMGILKTQNEPPMCMQVNPFTHSKTVEGQEDCLYLNVYAPERLNRTDKLPVIVYIHGGGWMSGSGGISLYSPSYFLEHDIVLVTGNYRLGPLGFLSMEDKECPGNFGLKDQALMLQWVRMNIDKFGGNSGSITIFGNSAGGASVNYHMISPMSKGLFDKAISQSGTLMNIWSDVPRTGLAKMRGIRLADKMNCPIVNTNFKEMVACLRKVDGKKITQALYDFFEWDTDPVVPFPPVVENAYQSEEEAFISSFRFNKHSLDIPWIVGLTSEEGLLKTAAFFKDKNKMNDLVNNWERVLPLSFYYDHLYEEDQKRITEQINEFYFSNQPISEASRENLTNLWSDGFFIGILENLEYRLRNNLRDQTFLYMFSHKGTATYSEIFGGESESFYGSCHADELLYLFPQHKTIPTFFSSIPSAQDKELTRLMTKLWVNFAETSNPTPSELPEFPLWLPARQLPFDYLAIGNQNGNSETLLSMEKGLMNERFEFWQKIRKDSPKWSISSFRDEL